jgi:2-dehydro-3-deoxyglucarate aldolase
LKNKLRRALLESQLSLGGWLQIGHPACAEIFARAGFDWVCVDLEHGAIGVETMTDIFRTLDAFDCVPVARLPVNDPVWIHRTLDAGARALIIPMVMSAQEAQRAVREAKYPPRGVRGFGYSRANMHGVDFQEYVAAANEEVAMIMQIEHRDAIAGLDAILQVEGIDATFIGPHDLSGSMGITGQMDHPQMLAALETYLAASANHKITPGLHVVRPTPQNIREAIDKGYRLIALGLDNVFLHQGAQGALEAARGTS